MKFICYYLKENRPLHTACVRRQQLLGGIQVHLSQLNRRWIQDESPASCNGFAIKKWLCVNQEFNSTLKNVIRLVTVLVPQLVIIIIMTVCGKNIILFVSAHFISVPADVRTGPKHVYSITTDD